MLKLLFSLRLLPLTIAAAGLLLAVKTVDIVRGGNEFAHLFFISSVKAQSPAAGAPTPSEPPTAPVAPKQEEKATDSPPAAPTAPEQAATPTAPAAVPPANETSAASPETKPVTAKDESPKADTAKTEAKAEHSPKEEKKVEEPKKENTKGDAANPEGEHKDEQKPAEEEAKPEPAPKPSGSASGDPKTAEGRGLSPNTRIFSPVELDILQNLSIRRTQLDGWYKDVETKENLLSDVEKRIDMKIGQIEEMKKELKEMIAQYNQEQDSKIKSLVKIYENMKPKDAARIFDEVEMPILLLVIDRMAEKKAAPILAAMDSKKAKQLTVELAEARRLQNMKLNKAKSAAAPVTPAPKP